MIRVSFLSITPVSVKQNQGEHGISFQTQLLKTLSINASMPLADSRILRGFLNSSPAVKRFLDWKTIRER